MGVLLAWHLRVSVPDNRQQHSTPLGLFRVREVAIKGGDVERPFARFVNPLDAAAVRVRPFGEKEKGKKEGKEGPHRHCQRQIYIIGKSE